MFSISISVAAQCLETAFEVSLANTNNDTVFGPPLDLLAIASEFDGSDLATATFEETTTFSSWLGEAEPQVNLIYIYFVCTIYSASHV